MRNRNLVRIAQETLKIVEDGFYYLENRKILLLEGEKSFLKEVIVFDENRLLDISEDEDHYFEKNFQYTSGAKFYIRNCDSYEMAMELERPLVMNFANAIYPGGGFLHGAIAQEEALCRTSSLYKSISSEIADEMYAYNRKSRSAVDSEYMLLSPNVSVFRNRNLELLDEPFMVSVITIPAPNKNGRAASVPQDILDKVMMNRIRKMFWVAARYGYRNLVLGAWGCGAFGHDTETVAGYFYKILVDEHYDKLFDSVAFAILNDESKIQSFKNIFGNALEDLDEYDDDEMEAFESPLYIEMAKNFPACNHIQMVGKENIGYTQGVMANGIPFEAELWLYKDCLNVSFVFPEVFKINEIEKNQLTSGNVTGYHSQFEGTAAGVLTIGMVDRGYIDDVDATIEYVTFLKDNGLLFFKTEIENGVVQLVTDINGEDLAHVTVLLKDENETLASTPLCFKDFPRVKNVSHLRVVK